MAQPCNTTVTVDGNKFDAHTAHVGISTVHDHTGMPQVGGPHYTIDCSVDLHDTVNIPYTTLSRLYDLANIVNRDKIVPIKVEFWTDETQDDAICTYSFDGWISEFHTIGGASGENHSLQMTFIPKLDERQYVSMKMGN
ncbi:MAG: hypothetical protein ABR905_18045 [Terracidiphilus sp.]|jgi:hypothetical protein